jgi:uridine kinase
MAFQERIKNMHSDDKILKITFDNGTETTCFPETQIRNIIKKNDSLSKILCYGALVNNEIVSLTYPLEVDSKISLLTLSDTHGFRIYRNSVSFLLCKAVNDCYPEVELEIKHSLGNGFYCSFDDITSKSEISKMLTVIDKYMQKLIEDKLPIARSKLYLENALNYFSSKNRKDKCDLLRFQNPSKVSVYQCDNFIDLAHGVLVDNTRLISEFKFIPYETGFILQFPEKEHTIEVPDLNKYKHLFNIFKTYKEWGRTVGIKTIGDLNEIIVRGNYQEMVEVEEAFQEKRIAEIADAIYSKRNCVKWILIAGPSSSGKTTFAHRLATQIKVNGIKPVIISVDNYFVDRDKTPRNENGDYDFEHIETIDLKLLHEHLRLLDKGKTVELPVFDFIKGKQYPSGKKIQLAKNEMVLIEGIHSLNPRMTESLPTERKFKIYISALTQLNLDNDSRISTTDNRLIRRIIRDHRTRGNRALATLQMWPNVRLGEKRWIFPYQHHADIAFNSALNYELAVLKPLAEPVLAEVKPWHPQYANARRLQNFLKNFSSGSVYPVPHKSLLREFVGGGIIE